MWIQVVSLNTSCFSKWDWWSSVLVPLWGSPKWVSFTRDVIQGWFLGEDPRTPNYTLKQALVSSPDGMASRASQVPGRNLIVRKFLPKFFGNVASRTKRSRKWEVLSSMTSIQDLGKDSSQLAYSLENTKWTLQLGRKVLWLMKVCPTRYVEDKKEKFPPLIRVISNEIA